MLKIAFLLMFLFTAFAGETFATDLQTMSECDGTGDDTKKVLNCVGKSGYHVYGVDMVCPIGDEKFEALRLGTHSTYGRHLDWEPVSYMRFPVAIPVCPSNGLVVVKEDYSKEELETLKKVIESEEYKKIYAEKHATYFLYAKTLELSGTERDDMWWLYLNATWEADNCNDEEKYEQYAKAVIESGKKRISKVKETEFEHWLLKLIVANMHRRIGDFETAKKLADEMGTPKMDKKDNNDFVAEYLESLNKAISEKNSKRVKIGDARDEFRKKAAESESKGDADTK